MTPRARSDNFEIVAQEYGIPFPDLPSHCQDAADTAERAHARTLITRDGRAIAAIVMIAAIAVTSDFTLVTRRPALLFQHRILHEATAVRAGEKLVLRTDVLYRPAPPSL
jgi:hypothetical protein